MAKATKTKSTTWKVTMKTDVPVVLVVRPSQIGTGRSAVAASRVVVKGLSQVVVHQLIHATSTTLSHQRIPEGIRE